MNNKRILWIVGVVVILILALAGYAIYNRTPENPDLNLKDVNAYSSEDYGISFSFPEKYVLEEREIGTSQQSHHAIMLITKADKEKITSGTSEGATSITIDIFSNPSGISIDQWIGESKDSNFDRVVGPIATTQIAGVQGAVYSWDGLYRANSIVFTHKNNIIMASMTYMSPEDEIWKDFPVILQTLKLY